MISAVLFILYGVSSATAVLLLKVAMARVGGLSAWRGTTGLIFATGATLYAASFLLWLRLLSRLPLSVAYPAAIGLTLVLSLSMSTVWLHERLSTPRLAGAALVFAGIVLLTRDPS
jgi:drug/metabolite transporter (DMT)-like permease